MCLHQCRGVSSELRVIATLHVPLIVGREGKYDTYIYLYMCILIPYVPCQPFWLRAGAEKVYMMWPAEKEAWSLDNCMF